MSRFDQVQLPSTTWCNYLWRSTHAFTLHSGIFIYIIYKRRWGDALHTNMFWTQHHDIFHNKPEVQSVMATPVDTNQNHKNWSLKINQFIKCLFENKTECSLKICCMMSVRGRFWLSWGYKDLQVARLLMFCWLKIIHWFIKNKEKKTVYFSSRSIKSFVWGYKKGPYKRNSKYFLKSLEC